MLKFVGHQNILKLNISLLKSVCGSHSFNSKRHLLCVFDNSVKQSNSNNYSHTTIPVRFQNYSKSNYLDKKKIWETKLMLKASQKFNDRSNRWHYIPYLFCFSIPFISQTEDEKPKDPVKVTMALVIEALEKKNYKEAEKYLHEVLHILQDQFDSREITEREFMGKRAHVYSSLANLGLLSQDPYKAETLFKEMMQDCLRCGMSPDDAVLIEVSLKLALIYAKRGDKNLAEEGFLYCINCEEKKLATMSSSDNVDEEDLQNEQALLGMCRNYYSQFLHDQGRNKEALAQAKLSLEMARMIYSEGHSNVINIQNDVAIFSIAVGDNKLLADAEKTLRNAIENCEKDGSLFAHLPTLYCNLGSLLHDSGRKAEALKMTNRALATLNSLGVPKDHPLRLKVDECLKNLKADKKTN